MSDTELLDKLQKAGNVAITHFWWGTPAGEKAGKEGIHIFRTDDEGYIIDVDDNGDLTGASSEGDNVREAIKNL